MGSYSEEIYKLRPVIFKYKSEVLKGDNSIQYGLIAEEAEGVNPLFVAHSNDGSIYTVKYQLLTPLMLNEIQKEHIENKKQALIQEDQDKKIKRLENEIAELRNLIINKNCAQ